MTLWGWTVMLLSVGGTISWIAWCLYKVLSTPDETHKVHGFDFDTPDRSDKS